MKDHRNALNQTNEHAQKGKRQDSDAAALRELIGDARATFGPEHGQRILQHIQHVTGCTPGKQRPAYERCVTAPATDGISQALAAAFADGRKSIFYEIEGLLEYPESELGESPSSLH